MEHLSAIKLKRTDTTLDLSRNGKGSLGEKRRRKRFGRGVYIGFWRDDECRVGGVKMERTVSHSGVGHAIAAAWVA